MGASSSSREKQTPKLEVAKVDGDILKACFLEEQNSKEMELDGKGVVFTGQPTVSKRLEPRSEEKKKEKMMGTNLRLSYPGSNMRATFTKTEEAILNDELPAKLLQDGKDNQKKLLHYACMTMSRLDLFGHVYFMKGFVNPGELTTRNEISLALLDMFSQELKSRQTKKRSKKQNEFLPVSLPLDDIEIAVVPSFEIIKMTMKVEELQEAMMKTMDRFTYESDRHSLYTKKVFLHLPENIKALLDVSRVPRPLANDEKPYLRVVQFFNNNDESPVHYVFIDELFLAICRLRKKKVEWKAKQYYAYFPFDKLEFALGLYGFKFEDIQPVAVPVTLRSEMIQCLTNSPSGDNVIDGFSGFCRFAESIFKCADKTKHAELMQVFDYINLTNQILPYFVKYYSETLSCEKRSISVATYMKKGMTSSEEKRDLQKKQQHRAKMSVRHGLVSNVPKEVTEFFPQNYQHIASLMLKCYPRLALFLHEQGCCPDKFCFATKMKIHAKGFPCVRSDELWKKQIEFVLKNGVENDISSDKVFRALCPEPITFWTPTEEDPICEPTPQPCADPKKKAMLEKQASTAAKIAEEQRKIEELKKAFKKVEETTKVAEEAASGEPALMEPKAEDVKDAPTWMVETPPSGSSGSEASNSTTGSSLDVHPEGTENSVVSEFTSSESQRSESVIDEDDARIHQQEHYDRMIKTLESENDRMKKNFNKQIASLERKSQTEQEVVVQLRTTNKDLKKAVETIEAEKKEVQVKLEGDIKRITAEKKKIEDNLLQLKTQKAIENPEVLIAERKKMELAMKKKSDDHNKAIKTKDEEIETLIRELSEQKATLQKLQKENQELTDGALYNKEVCNLRMKNLEQESKIKQLEANETFNEQINEEIKKQCSLMEAQKNSAEGKLKHVENQAEKIRFLTEIKHIYENHAYPSVKAAVRRIEYLTRLLENAQKDERVFENAAKRLDAYREVERPDFEHAVLVAQTDFAHAKNMKAAYEKYLEVVITEIKTNVPLYFQLENVGTDPMSYPRPFSTETENRMFQLRREMSVHLDEAHYNIPLNNGRGAAGPAPRPRRGRYH